MREFDQLSGRQVATPSLQAASFHTRAARFVLGPRVSYSGRAFHTRAALFILGPRVSYTPVFPLQGYRPATTPPDAARVISHSTILQGRLPLYEIG